ncbi:MAG TPA: hypothetical protein VK151_16400 [Fluviicola sp.]|nr:hypothetical protein [Fluviicola sp.]
MKTLVILVAGISLSALSDNTQGFDQQLLEAEAYCRQLEPEAGRVAAQYQLTAAEILPIVYPECARYSALSNRAEATVLEYYYIEGGTAAADFSVGHFQMKPGFAEALEQRLLTDDKLNEFRGQFSYASTEVEAVREERLNRLLDQTWQLHYLCLFYKIMLLDHGDRLTDPQERTAFFAAAYNYGFTSDQEAIGNWRNTTAFPNGKGEAGNYNYADLAVTLNQKMRSDEGR